MEQKIINVEDVFIELESIFNNYEGYERRLKAYKYLYEIMQVKTKKEQEFTEENKNDVFTCTECKMKTSDYIDYEKMLKDVISKQLENKEIDYSYYDDKNKKEYEQFINTIIYLDSFYYKFETENCSINSDNIAEVILLFEYENEEEIYSLYLKLNLDEEWIVDFCFN